MSMNDAELRHTFQRAQRLRPVFRRAPDALACDAHGAEAETMNLGVAANLERAGFPSVELSHGDSFKLASPHNLCSARQLPKARACILSPQGSGTIGNMGGRYQSEPDRLLRMCSRSGSEALLTTSADNARSCSAWLAKALICSSQNVTCSRAISTGFFAPARLRAR